MQLQDSQSKRRRKKKEEIPLSVNGILLYGTCNLGLILVLFGVVFPLMLSSNMTEIVILGLVFLLVIPFLFWNLNKPWIRKIFK